MKCALESVLIVLQVLILTLKSKEISICGVPYRNSLRHLQFLIPAGLVQHTARAVLDHAQSRVIDHPLVDLLLLQRIVRGLAHSLRLRPSIDIMARLTSRNK